MDVGWWRCGDGDWDGDVVMDLSGLVVVCEAGDCVAHIDDQCRTYMSCKFVSCDCVIVTVMCREYG